MKEVKEEKTNDIELDDITEDLEEKDEITDDVEIKEELKEEEKKEVPKENKADDNNKKKIIFISIIGVLLLLLVGVLIIILTDNKKNQDEPNKEEPLPPSGEVVEKTSLTDKEYQFIVNAYGDAATLAVQNYLKTSSGTMPEFTEIKDWIVFEVFDVTCDISEVNYDGSVYLKSCQIDSYTKNDSFTYGEKKEEPPQVGDIIYIYKYSYKYQSTSGAVNENVYYNFFKEIKTIDNYELVGEYHCSDENCKAYDVYGKTHDLLVYDGAYYLYNLTTTQKKKISIGSEDYYSIKLIGSDTEVKGLSIYSTLNSGYALYNLEYSKFVTGFLYDAHITSFDNLIKKGYVLGSVYGNEAINSYLINLTTGKQTKTISNAHNFSEEKVGDKTFYTAFHSYTLGDDQMVYNENLDPIVKGDAWYSFSINTNGTITVNPRNDKKFYIYDSNGNILYTSKTYNNILKVVKDYVIVLEENKDLNIYNLTETKVATLLNVTDNYSLHPYVSGWYTENDKNGIYFVVENKNIPFGTLGSGLEYYYIPSTGETGVIQTEGVGGYAKPVLYLYPEKETKVTINFEKEELLTTTYPKFKNDWQVTAHPNGDLYDKNGNYYYGLYWEEEGSTNVDFSEGFYVEKDDAITFLEEKLTTLGLNAKERNEFIMYWLPILEKNEKSLVYFETTEERELYNKIIINPAPDALLRIAIHVKKVEEYTPIKEQTLIPFERKGFTAVEWGGVIH